MATKIYALTAPDSKEYRYIGKTISNLASRLQGHLYPVRSGKDTSKKAEWIQSVLAAGVLPRIVLICEVPEYESWQAAERREIARSRSEGNRLFNKCPGGNGSHKIINKVVMTEGLRLRLGVEPDAMIAADLGVTRKAIAYHRQKMGIKASFNRTRNVPPPSMGGHNRIEFDASVISLLGTMSDAGVSLVAGCSKAAIIRIRHALGIASYSDTTGYDGRFNGKGKHPRWGTEINRS